mgnify:CR=1 FL=1
MHSRKRFDSAARALSVWLLPALFVVLLASAPADAQQDLDNDFVPDAFDNCLEIPNGPNEVSNQVDTDVDGYGNACDGDYDNSLTVDTSDYATGFLPTLAGPGTLTDHDGNGIVTVTDFSVFLRQFSSGAPGPSGLACAGTIPCTP